jgi:hypothetical protein
METENHIGTYYSQEPNIYKSYDHFALFTSFAVREMLAGIHYFERYLHRKDRKGRKELVKYVWYSTINTTEYNHLMMSSNVM